MSENDTPATPPPPADPVHSPPPPVRERRPGGFQRGFGMGFGLAVGAGIVAVVLAVVSLFAFVGGLAALGSAAQRAQADPVETVWGRPGAANTIVAVQVTGPILGTSGGDPTAGLFGAATYGYDVAKEIDDLDKDDAAALLIELDTPGGTIYGSKAIFDAIERYKERTGKPAVAYVRGMSASGGMYAMAGADEIIVDHGTMVGSIGVILGPLERYRDVRGITGTLLTPGVETEGGITQEYLTRGTGKDFGNPFRDMTEQERAVMDQWLDAEYNAFVSHVATSREIPEQRIREEFGAFIFGPDAAVANGLADSRLGQEEAYRHVADLAGVDPQNTRVVTAAPDTFTSLLFGARAGQSEQARLTGAEAAQRDLAASPLCTGGPSVLVLHGDLGTYCG